MEINAPNFSVAYSGARGLGALRSALIGSVSQAVLQASRVPVTIVKHAQVG